MSTRNSSTPMWRHVRLLTLSLGVILVVAACEGSSGVATTVAAPTENVVEVDLFDFGFRGLPDSVPVGTRLTVKNSAPSELHEMVVFRLPDGENRSTDELAMLPPQELEHAFGGPPVAVLLAAPGGPQIPAVGDGVLSAAGRYAIFCFIPTGVDPEVYLAAAATSEGAPQVDGGPPHFVHGMHRSLTVTGG